MQNQPHKQIQKLVPVKRNGDVLTLQVPPPNLQGSTFPSHPTPMQQQVLSTQQTIIPSNQQAQTNTETDQSKVNSLRNMLNSGTKGISNLFGQ